MHWNWRLKKKWSIFYHQRKESSSGMECYYFLRVARRVRTDASTAGMGLRLLTVYYGLGYMLPTMSQFQVGISYCLVFFARIPLVHYLDTILIHSISKAMDSLRFKHLGAADFPDSILYCIQSSLCSNACLEWVFLYWDWWWIIGFQVHLSYGKLWH